MSDCVRKIAILGSTGSIGRSTLDVVNACSEQLQVVGLTAHSQLDELCQQARQVRPRWVVAADLQQANRFDWSLLPRGTTILRGQEGIEQLAGEEDVEIVVAAIVGSVGLRGTWAAVSAGKVVALANKETLVMAGPLVMQLAQQRGAQILPIDSEHNAVFQALHAGRRSEVKRIVLTASGGPFRRHTPQQLQEVTVQDALAHPTWEMGPKITVDSATMMNKALEVIEARWLFDLPPEQIEVVVHPQSIVHSMVEFRDGSVMAQLSPPDMRLPIQYALTYPRRRNGASQTLDLTTALELQFEPPDFERFPALQLGFEVARQGGTAGAVLNAANEAAVEGFLGGHLRFQEIADTCRSVLNSHEFDASPTLDQLIRLDRWARQEVNKWVCS